MICHNTKDQLKSNFYIEIFEDLTQGNNQSAKEFIDSAIFEAAEIANGRKDLFSIKANSYFLVTTLLENFDTGLRKLKDKKAITNQVYNQVLNVLLIRNG